MADRETLPVLTLMDDRAVLPTLHHSDEAGEVGLKDGREPARAGGLQVLSHWQKTCCSACRSRTTRRPRPWSRIPLSLHAASCMLTRSRETPSMAASSAWEMRRAGSCGDPSSCARLTSCLANLVERSRKAVSAMYSVDRRSRAHRSSMMRDIASGLCPKKDMNSLRAMNSSSQASRATAVALRPLPSSRAISPKNSPGTEDVQDQPLALHGVHGEGNAARQDAVEAVAGVALLEEYVAGRNAPGHVCASAAPRASCSDSSAKKGWRRSRSCGASFQRHRASARRQSGQLRQAAQERREPYHLFATLTGPGRSSPTPFRCPNEA